MTELKSIKINCPKCWRELLRLCFGGILLAPQTAFGVICGRCGSEVNIPDAFPEMFHKATPEELLPTTVPYRIEMNMDDRKG